MDLQDTQSTNPEKEKTPADPKDSRKNRNQVQKQQKIVFSTAKHHKYDKKFNKKPIIGEKSKPDPNKKKLDAPKKEKSRDKLPDIKYTREALKEVIRKNAQRIEEDRIAKEKRKTSKKNKNMAKIATKKGKSVKAPSANSMEGKTNDTLGQDDILDINPTEDDLNLEPQSPPPQSGSKIYQGRNLDSKRK